MKTKRLRSIAGDMVRQARVPTLILLILAVAASVFAAGPPEPTPPPSTYKIGALHWPLWTQGTHFGWELIDRDTWSNRRPLLDMYDEDSPEVWGWFNYRYQRPVPYKPRPIRIIRENRS